MANAIRALPLYCYDPATASIAPHIVVRSVPHGSSACADSSHRACYARSYRALATEVLKLYKPNQVLPPARYGIAFGQYIEVNKRLQSRLWIGMPRRGWVCGEPHGANLAFMAL